VVGFERGDDGQRVAFDGAVHLSGAGVTAGFGAGDQRAGVVELAAVVRQEFGRCDKRVGRSTTFARGQDFCSGTPWGANSPLQHVGYVQTTSNSGRGNHVRGVDGWRTDRLRVRIGRPYLRGREVRRM
jgi:hypothetical protein